jgi:hypothetical protein
MIAPIRLEVSINERDDRVAFSDIDFFANPKPYLVIWSQDLGVDPFVYNGDFVSK